MMVSQTEVRNSSVMLYDRKGNVNKKMSEQVLDTKSLSDN